MNASVHHGMNLRDALRVAACLGCSVHHPRRTGDVVVAHPAFVRSARCNSRRKDAPRVLTSMLLQLLERYPRTPHAA